MRVLIVAGLTCWVPGWIHRTTRHQINAIIQSGGEAALVADVAIPGEDRPRFFPMKYPPDEQSNRQIEEAIAAFKPDVIHVSCGGAGLLNSVERIACSNGIPWLFTAHNIPPAERAIPKFYGQNRLYYSARDLLGLPSTMAWGKLLRRGQFRAVVVHSKTVQERALARGCAEDKLIHFPFGADLAQTRAEATADELAASPFTATGNPKLLCVAGMIHHKGLHDLLRAIAELKPEFPNIEGVFIGSRREEGYRLYLLNLIAQLGLEKNAKILLNASDTVLAAAWANAAVYVQPSHEEGFCLSFLEGLMAVPRGIGTETGAMAEMVKGDPLAKVVATRSPQALAKAIRELMAMPITSGHLQSRQERLRNKFSWSQYEAQHGAAYSAVSNRV